MNAELAERTWYLNDFFPFVRFVQIRGEDPLHQLIHHIKRHAGDFF